MLLRGRSRNVRGESLGSSELQRNGSPKAAGGSVMHFKDARALLGVPINATVPQVKAAYKKKALENHPDRFPPDCKSQAEARFKLISEAYTCLRSDRGSAYQSAYSGNGSMGVMYRRGRWMPSLVTSLPFALLIVGTVSLGFSCAASAYRKQQQESPARHPFLP